MLATMAAEPEEPKKKLITQLRVEPDLWERVKSQAVRRRLSANSYVLLAVETAVTTDEAAERQRLLGT